MIVEKKSKMKLREMMLIDNTNRIKIENKNIKGSISLEGAIIDDITFQKLQRNLKW